MSANSCPSSNMSNSSNSDVQDSFGRRNKKLRQTGEYSDFVIECASRQFKVHRSIICPQSSFLETLCSLNFKVDSPLPSTFRQEPAEIDVKEGMEGKASLKETDPGVFDKALDFLYTGTYDDGNHETAVTLTPTTGTIPANQGSDLPTAMTQPDMNSVFEITSTELISLQENEDRLSELPNCERSPLLLNVRLYHLAEFLQVESLKREALKRCTELLDECFDAPSFIPGIREALSYHVNGRNFELGAKMVKSCVKNAHLVASHSALEGLLMDFEPIAWTALTEQQRRHEQDQEEHAREISALKEQVNSLEQINKSHMHDLSNLREKIEVVEKLLDEYNSCRNC